MVYVHPLLGVFTLGLLVWLATVGLRARHQARYAADARRLHRRISNWVLGLYAATALLGLLSAGFLRDDLSVAGSRHFLAALAGLALMGLLYALGRRISTSRIARRSHPWVGYLALATGVALFVLGFSLLPG